MLSRDKLSHVTNILNLKNPKVKGVNHVLDVITAIEQEDNLLFLNLLLDDDQDRSLLDSVFTAIKHEPDHEEDILDSFSDNQVLAKTNLVNGLDNLNLLNKETEVVIFGCWYGSILIPLLHDKVKSITAIDVDDHAISIGQNRFFDQYDNITWITGDIFEDYRDMFDTADIFINTSCEHMLPMKWWGPKGPRKDHDWFKEWNGDYRREWKGKDENKWPVYDIGWWERVKPSAHFAFTSNNMYDIPGHINCVDSIEKFKVQLPAGAEVLTESELEDERGIMYLLIGKL